LSHTSITNLYNKLELSDEEAVESIL